MLSIVYNQAPVLQPAPDPELTPDLQSVGPDLNEIAPVQDTPATAKAVVDFFSGLPPFNYRPRATGIRGIQIGDLAPEGTEAQETAGHEDAWKLALALGSVAGKSMVQDKYGRIYARDLGLETALDAQASLLQTIQSVGTRNTLGAFTLLTPNSRFTDPFSENSDKETLREAVKVANDDKADTVNGVRRGPTSDLEITRNYRPIRAARQAVNITSISETPRVNPRSVTPDVLVNRLEDFGNYSHDLSVQYLLGRGVDPYANPLPQDYLARNNYDEPLYPDKIPASSDAKGSLPRKSGWLFDTSLLQNPEISRSVKPQIPSERIEYTRPSDTDVTPLYSEVYLVDPGTEIRQITPAVTDEFGWMKELLRPDHQHFSYPDTQLELTKPDDETSN